MGDDDIRFDTAFFTLPAFSYGDPIPPCSTSSDDNIGFDTAFLTLPPFSYTGPIPPFSTRDPDVLPTFPSESFPPTFTQTPTTTNGFPSSTGTTSTIDPSTPLPSQTDPFSSDPLPSSFPTSFGSSLANGFPPTSDSSSTTSYFSSTSFSPSSTSSNSIRISSGSSPTISSQTFTTTSFPPTTTTPNNPIQPGTSNRTGLIVVIATNAIALAITAALLAILCRRRYPREVYHRVPLDPSLDFEHEMVAINQPSGRPFDPGATARSRYTDRTTDHGPSSPGRHSPGNAEAPLLPPTFSVASELNPQYPTHSPTLNMDEMRRSSPDPIQPPLSHRPTFDHRQSFTPSIGGPPYESGDVTDITPLDLPTQGTTGPGLVYSSSPHTIQDGNIASRLSTIPEIIEKPVYSQGGSYDSTTWVSGDTSTSLPLVTMAERIHVTPGPTSIPLMTQTYIDSSYGEPLPLKGATDKFPQLPPMPDGPSPVPSLPQVQPLSLGKKRVTQSSS